MQDITCNNCGLVNEYEIRQAGPHQSAYCNGCGRYIKHIPKPVSSDTVIQFGKYKGTSLKDFTTPEHVSWLNWLLRSCELERPTYIKQPLIDAITKHLSGS